MYEERNENLLGFLIYFGLFKQNRLRTKKILNTPIMKITNTTIIRIL